MVKIPGVLVTMGGKEREIPPLSFKALKRLGPKLATLNVGSVSEEAVATILEATFLAIQRNYPDVTMEELEDELDVGNMTDVIQAIMDVSGLRRKAQEEASKEKEANQEPSTGTT
jgi:hypothetical protein